MSYSPSPRPAFDGPAHISYEGVTRHLWGDETAGRVSDWIYVSNELIHLLVFGLPVGGSFRHSDQFRTVFAADEVLYVLQGRMIMANPETGEVHRVESGEALFFRKDTWQHCFNDSREPLRVLEYFAPPPSQGTSGAYAQTRPNLAEPKYSQDRWLENWPMGREQARQTHTMQVIRPGDLLWRLEGRQDPVLTGILASTEHLTVGRLELRAGQRSEAQVHGGDEALYLLEGTLNLYLPDHEGQQWFELNPGDGFYLPGGMKHQYYNMMSDGRISLLFGVAPRYLP